ncbi:inorganic phosphate transporter [Paracoccus aerodenitrificans]|uniref:inorganic phosphate transporter n=1 Tax=Paracoccus aerodenitrificans TaxID=3017781 RepID=UPI0022F09982|nr:inorganic phosphate transporter [Paracoccus aerodenitrificans]WBU63977.1 inorganic phosphate transporter [Paracoccus aerodenitrificans]
MAKHREYRILGKDLDRLSHVEGAGHSATRPLLRFGFCLGLVVLLLLLAAATGIHIPTPAPLITGFAVAVYLGMSVGANDVANSAGAAVSAKAMPLWLGLAAIAAAQLAGALLAGEEVTRTIASGIFDSSQFGPDAPSGRVMAAALIGAAIWITLANWARAPVSTTHSVIGAIAGAALTGLGIEAINLPVLASIAISWMIAPVISAMIAAAVLSFLRRRVKFAEDRLTAARFWLPALIGLTGTVFAGFLLALPGRPEPGIFSLLACAGFGILSAAASRWQLERQIAAGPEGSRLSLKKLLTGPLVATALLSGFAHGANDVANIAGPLSVIMQYSNSGSSPSLTVAIAGVSVAAGSLIFGRRLVRMVGTSITRLNPTRAFCAALAAAATVLSFSALGLPVSTTHCTVGGILGVGFYREWEDRRRRKSRDLLPAEELYRRKLVRRSHVWTTFAAWAVTVPGSGAAAALIYTFLTILS